MWWSSTTVAVCAVSLGATLAPVVLHEREHRQVNHRQGDARANADTLERKGSRLVAPEFSGRDRHLISAHCLSSPEQFSFGYALGGDGLRRGADRQVERDGILPVELRRRLRPLPWRLRRQLAPLAPGFTRGSVAGFVVVVDERNWIVTDLIPPNRNSIAATRERSEPFRYETAGGAP